MAMKAAPEQIAYVALLNVGKNGKRDAMSVIDLEPGSSTYGQLLGQVDFPNGDNELHHFGWNACSACLCPQAPHPHMERRYLIVPGIGSSRIHILDTKADPKHPKIVKVIETEEFIKKTGYTSPHTIHCGDRKSTRLNSSHGYISYAVFCLKKKKETATSSTDSPRESTTSLPLR